MTESLLLAVPALVLLLGAWRPRLGLAVLAAALPLFGAPPAGPYLSALDLSALAALAVALRQRRRGAEERGGGCPLAWPVTAWLAVSLVSLLPPTYLPPSWQPRVLADVVASLPHADPLVSQFEWRVAQQLLVGLALFWAFRRVFIGRSVRPIALGLAIGAGYVVALGLVEQMGWIDLSAYRPIGAPRYETRLHSLFFHSGWLSEYLVIAAPFALAGLYCGTSRWSRPAGHVLLALTAVCLLLTQQRGAWLAAIAQAVAVLLLAGTVRSRRPRPLGALLAAAISFVLVLGALSWTKPEVVETLRARILTVGGDLSGRWWVWLRSADLASQSHHLGVGLGNFAAAYAAEHPCGAGEHCWLTAHSLYVHVFVERGLLGLAALLVLGGAAAACQARIIRDGPGENRVLGLGLVTSLVGVAVYGFVQYPLFLQSLEWLCWILLASTTILAAGGVPPGAHRAAKLLAVLALVSLPLRWALLPPPSAAARDFGFHRPEILSDGRTVRWTSPRAGRRLGWEGETLVVELIDGHPSHEARPLEVSLEIPGIAEWRGAVGTSWTRVRLEVGEATRAWLALLIEAHPPFRPYRDFLGRPELEPSRDIRSLGVVIGRINWERFLLENRTVTDRQSIRSERSAIVAGNLGTGDYVVGPTASVTLIAPSVELVNGFAAGGGLILGNP